MPTTPFQLVPCDHVVSTGYHNSDQYLLEQFISYLLVGGTPTRSFPPKLMYWNDPSQLASDTTAARTTLQLKRLAIIFSAAVNMLDSEMVEQLQRCSPVRLRCELRHRLSLGTYATWIQSNLWGVQYWAGTHVQSYIWGQSCISNFNNLELLGKLE